VLVFENLEGIMAKGKQSRRVNISIGCLFVIAIIVYALFTAQRSTNRAAATPTATSIPSATMTDTPRATRTPMLQSTQPPKPVIAPQSPFGCNQQDDLNCSDFRAIGQNANAHLAQCGDEDNLDGDGDGRACESN
jgi:hypothetical protein